MKEILFHGPSLRHGWLAAAHNGLPQMQLLHDLRHFRRAGGVDIVLTHAPARGFGDAEDFAHCGFEAFLPLLDRYQPRYLIHGHVHTEYGHAIPRVLQRGGTTIINACERYTLEL